MTDLTTPSKPALDAVVLPPSTAPAAEATAAAVVITEQEVLFSTAAAVPVQPALPHRLAGAAHALTVGLRGLFAGKDKPRRHYPSRMTYLESSLMSREMDRL